MFNIPVVQEPSYFLMFIIPVVQGNVRDSLYSISFPFMLPP